MTIDTNHLVEILKNDQPLSVMMVEDNGKDKLICLFALPHLTDKIAAFAKSLLEAESNVNIQDGGQEG